MPGVLYHTPGQILAQVLIDLGYGVFPDTVPADDAGLWPVKTAVMPDAPDNVICVIDTAGISRQRDMVTGERSEFPGVQVMVRANKFKVAKRKAVEIAVGLDSSVYQEEPVIDGVRYTVHAVKRTSTVILVGKETPASSRWVFSVNAEMTVRMQN